VTNTLLKVYMIDSWMAGRIITMRKSLKPNETLDIKDGVIVVRNKGILDILLDKILLKVCMRRVEWI
jgi:hypothetical protein